MKKINSVIKCCICAMCIMTLMNGCGSKENNSKEDSSSQNTKTEAESNEAESNKDNTKDRKEETLTELENGTYTVEAVLNGGSGKAKITSPLKLKVENSKAVAVVEWSSPNYDYMLVKNKEYLPVNTEGNSVFEIPVEIGKEEISVIADTIAMSQPREIEYTIVLDYETLEKAE